MPLFSPIPNLKRNRGDMKMTNINDIINHKGKAITDGKLKTKLYRWNLCKRALSFSHIDQKI